MSIENQPSEAESEFDVDLGRLPSEYKTVDMIAMDVGIKTVVLLAWKLCRQHFMNEGDMDPVEASMWAAVPAVILVSEPLRIIQMYRDIMRTHAWLDDLQSAGITTLDHPPSWAEGKSLIIKILDHKYVLPVAGIFVAEGVSRATDSSLTGMVTAVTATLITCLTKTLYQNNRDDTQYRYWLSQQSVDAREGWQIERDFSGEVLLPDFLKKDSHEEVVMREFLVDRA